MHLGAGMTTLPERPPSPDDLLPSVTAIEAAARRIAGVARQTPLRRSAALSRLVGGDVYLKLETEQVTGSFKLRGALNAIATLPEERRARGVVAASAGNHGLGVAYAARHVGVPATVFVPASAPAVKKGGIAAFGASVDDASHDYDAAHRRALAHAQRTGAAYVDPCAGDALLAGQGTVALEVLGALPDVSTLLVPVGGAGLIGGIGALVRARAARARVVGVQSTQTAAMARSLRAGHVVEIPSVPTLADGLAGQIDDYALAIGRAVIAEMVTVTEDAIADAIAWLSCEERLTVEGAGAVTTAALLGAHVRTSAGPVVAVVSGGNIDPARHAEIARRAARG